MTLTSELVDVARRSILDWMREDGSPRWIRVRGSSMLPAIPVGSWILVDFSSRGARVGDVVVADIGRTIVVHRVVHRPGPGRRGVVLKGDAEPRGDPRITPDAVYGTVRAVRWRGVTSTAGMEGGMARTVALASRLASRAAVPAARLASRAPSRLRRAAIECAVAMTQVPLRALTSTFLLRHMLDGLRAR